MDEYALQRDVSVFRDKIISWDKKRRSADTQKVKAALGEADSAIKSGEKAKIEAAAQVS